MRHWNFSAGPASIPTEVLETAQKDLLDWNGMGCSVMEISHRSAPFMALVEQAEVNLRSLMGIPDDYAVLYTQGGASLQFSMVPLNLSTAGQLVGYIDTGIWSAKAIKEASRYGEVHLVGKAQEGSARVPSQDELDLSPDNLAYVHYTPNETIGGLAFDYIPDTGSVPLVADMSSVILSETIDVTKFDVIYAGAQKNIGPSGICLVIVKKSLLGQARDECPALLNWQSYAENDSMFNTPPTFAWYLAGEVYKWLQKQGGVEAMSLENSKKAKRLYGYIDQSDFYSNPIQPSCRSRMNVPFVLADESLNSTFLKESESAGLLFLKGHRSVGGMRASIYNALPLAAIEALVSFMEAFASRYQGA